MIYVDIPRTDYDYEYDVNNLLDKTYREYYDYCITEDDFNTTYDNRVICSGVESIYNDEFNEYLNEYFLYLEYNEVFN